MNLGGHLRHAGAGSSRPMSANDEPIEQLKGDIKEMQIYLLRVINNKTLDREQLYEMQGRFQWFTHVGFVQKKRKPHLEATPQRRSRKWTATPPPLLPEEGDGGSPKKGPPLEAPEEEGVPDIASL
ncbi:hypothetical protein Scep_007590 [Stephania cephalantha]|uniref:Uncharacterized protein n=1 Tax=Stephania cephalantha TaxID=152367 RepID=A0AAP0KBZ7_9MAGN